ncbi:MAG: cell division protein ZapB [Proteobacteria bacterium]|nr:cell division protein ZapB [Pseudomonadota bacterium]
MENNAELVRLEEFVDKLLNKYNRLKSDFHALQEKLHDRDTECAELKSTIQHLTTERTEVGNRVSGLLDRIEQWEADQEGVAADRSGGYESIQGSLFHDGPDGKNN